MNELVRPEKGMLFSTKRKELSSREKLEGLRTLNTWHLGGSVS